MWLGGVCWGEGIFSGGWGVISKFSAGEGDSLHLPPVEKTLLCESGWVGSW